MTGIGRGLLGAMSLPVSGVLGFVGTVTAGLASSVGVVPGHGGGAAQRTGRRVLAGDRFHRHHYQQQQLAQGGMESQQAQQQEGEESQQQQQQQQQQQHLQPLQQQGVAAALLWTRLGQGALLGGVGGRYLAHSCIASLTVLREGGSLQQYLLLRPTVLLAEGTLVVFSGVGAAVVPAVLVLLPGATLSERYGAHQVVVRSPAVAPASAVLAAEVGSVVLEVGRHHWTSLLPVLRRAVQVANAELAWR